MSRPSKQHAPLQGSFDTVLKIVADENKPTPKIVGARPFLKWVGGKRSILPTLLEKMPKQYTVYREPFLGGGALFFAVQPKAADLSDVNFHLILGYRAVRDDVDGLLRNLKIHAAKHNKEYYGRARERLGKEQDPTKIGALLIYLNKTCFNGLYRVNKDGLFNVPIGDYDDPPIVDEDNLRAVSKALKGVEIEQRQYWQTKIERANFYYLDPPYHKVYEGYDAGGFGDEGHKKLAGYCKDLDKAGCYFMLSNSDTSLIRSLYKGFTIESVMASRMVSCKANQRNKQSELIIRNY